MNRLVLFTIFFFILSFTHAQFASEFNPIISETPSFGTYRLVGFYSNVDNRRSSNGGIYTVDSIRTDGSHYFMDVDCHIYEIVYSSYTSPLTLEVNPINHNHVPKFGRGQLTSPNLENRQLYVTSGVVRKVQDCVLNYNIDSLNIENEPGVGVTDFDSNRPILRTPSVGTVIGDSTVAGWLEWWYFTPPSMTSSINTTLVEVGTVNSVTFSIVVANPSNTTLSNGTISRTSPDAASVASFSDNPTGSFNFSFEPQKDSLNHYERLAYTFDATQDWDGGGSSGSISPPARTVTAVYPVLYGMSATDLHSGGSVYTELIKAVTTEGNKNYIIDGVNQYIYYAIPVTWTDTNLSSIKDGNDFEVLGAFTPQTISVTSVGLVNNWTIDYVVYKLDNLTTANNANYKFNR